MAIERIVTQKYDRHPQWAGYLADHTLEKSSWIGPDTWDLGKPLLLKYQNTIQHTGYEKIIFHISADQRYRIYIDGKYQACGPDRSDLYHWPLTTYQWTPEEDTSLLEVYVWWLSQKIAPMAQMSHRPGLIVAGESSFSKQLNTGIANWRVFDLSKAIKCTKPHLPSYHAIGPEFHTDLSLWNNTQESNASVLVGPQGENFWGCRSAPWRFHPTRLQEQQSTVVPMGTVLSRRNHMEGTPWAKADRINPLSEKEASFFRNEVGHLTIAANQEIEYLIDHRSYVCGYPVIGVNGGKGTILKVEWAESLFQENSSSEVRHKSSKSHRGEWLGKVFLGLGDSWQLDGNKQAELPIFWWRAGRYLKLVIHTKEEPLQLEYAYIRITGYPYNEQGSFHCSDLSINKIWPILRDGIRHCAHEQWIDSPYYEQLSYVGDCTAALGHYCLTNDDSITKRSLELFDWSRDANGWVAQRYPSTHRQDSFTYSMLYPRLVLSQAFWRDDDKFILSRLPGLRAMLHEGLSWVGQNGLVGKVPGWSFIDWVDSWHEGCAPGVREGDSSLVNLHLYFALNDLALLEKHFGEKNLEVYWTNKKHDLGQRIIERYWSKRKNLIADDGEHRHFSEHAQAWILLTELLDTPQKQACLRAWGENESILAPMSIYFSHYGLEALYHMQSENAFFAKLSFWKNLSQQGFCTTPEQPEPSRSDCHGWGGHPLYHLFASVAGIRPSSPGFRTVKIKPMPGPIDECTLRMPHPSGMINASWSRKNDLFHFKIELPDNVAGVFEYKNDSIPLEAGLQNYTEPTAYMPC